MAKSENKGNIRHRHFVWVLDLYSFGIFLLFVRLFIWTENLPILSYLFVNDYQEHLNENPRNWKHRTDTTINLASTLPVFANTSWIVFISSRLHFCTTSALCMLRPLAIRCHGHMLQRHSTTILLSRRMLIRLAIHLILWFYATFITFSVSDQPICSSVMISFLPLTDLRWWMIVEFIYRPGRKY